SPIFPRSVRFSVGEVDRALAAIAGEQWHYADESADWPRSEVQRSIGKLRSALFYARTDEVIRSGLSAYLIDVENRCRQIGDQMYAEFFSPRIMRPEEVMA
ncbi:MAG: alpha-E domain-containing protein, partial [Thermomicrobiales bacterium]